jgi:hypothetical protein
LWRVKTNGDFTCRASLESAQTGERRGFESLESMLEFLKAQMGQDGSRICQVAEKRR